MDAEVRSKAVIRIAAVIVESVAEAGPDGVPESIIHIEIGRAHV